MRTYEGWCHCRSVGFRMSSREITTGARCNCSICAKRGAVMSSAYFAPHEFALLGGRDMLQVYHFGERTVNHYFCKRCGIYTFHDTIGQPGHFRVNLGCVEGVEAESLSLTMIDGRSF